MRHFIEACLWAAVVVVYFVAFIDALRAVSA
jgi:hypothetical protein